MAISGYSGKSGYSGFSGKVGLNGLVGLAGACGLSGYSGYSGQDGIASASGYSGQDGADGLSGYSGSKGRDGLDGARGADGYDGASGLSGYSGQNGLSGYSGATGQGGASGYSGQNAVVVSTTLQYANTVNIDFNAGGSRLLTLSGNVLFTTSNTAIDKSVTLKIEAGSAARTLSYPAWRFVGASIAPTTLAANKVAILSLTAYGPGDGSVIAAYAAQP